MALPPGTSGWVGSGFDCGCTCTVEAGFAYYDDVCLLIFTAGNILNGCTPVDIETADITIELFLNGSPLSATLIPGIGNTLFWEKWKPTAGDVYSATVTLDCGGGDVVVREAEITIPTPANTACVCCTERIPDYLVVSASGCCDIANGTFALSASGGSCALGTKEYNYSNSDVFGAPASPCSAGACYTVFDSGTGRTYYFWKRGILMTVTMPPTAGPDNITITMTFTYRVYYNACTLFSSNVGVSYQYTLTCSGGSAGTPSGGSVLLAFGFTATPCSSAPAVQLYFQ